MTEGKVRFYDDKKGYGFIDIDDFDIDRVGVKEVFFHYTQIKNKENLISGDFVEFKTKSTKKGIVATKIFKK